MLPNLNGSGRLIEDPSLRYSASGTAVVTVRLAFNSRKKDQNGNWVDDATFFVDGKAFGPSAENIAGSLTRGLEVVVSGRMKTESWETKEGEKRSSAVLMLDSIGPSLRNSTARVEKVQSGQGQSSSGGWGGAPQGSQDPWASQAPAAAGAGWGAQQGGDTAPPF